MRIVHYHPRAVVGDGGVSNSVRRLSAALADAGADAVIAYDARDGNPADDGAVTWLPVPHRGGGEIRIPVGLDRLLEPTDVVVLNSAWTVHNQRAAAAAARVGAPYVLAPRGAYDPLILRRRAIVKRAWWALAEGRMVRGAAGIHAFFPEQEAHARALGFRGRVVVAPNGITVPAQTTWDGGSGGYVLYLGRFDPEHKGLDLLLEAQASLDPSQRPALRMAGPDWKGGRARTVEMVTRLGLQESVTLLPPAYGDAKWELFARAAGFVYPSRWEGFGNSLAEAAAIGVPALATPYPLAQHLEGRGAAIVVAPEVGALAEGLVRLCTSPPPDRAAAAQLRAEFTWNAVARAWLDQVGALSAAVGGRDHGSDRVV